MKPKTIHELRSTAQGMGVTFTFSDDSLVLQQKIDAKLQDMVPKPKIVPERPAYDPRIRDKPPAKITTENSLNEALASHRQLGLIVTFPDYELWHMRCGVKEDSGTMRAPLRDVIAAAERLMR